MKKMSVLFVLLLSGAVFALRAQKDMVIDNFEAGDQGWSPVDEGWVDFAIVNNPHIDDVNPSAKVMKITRKVGTANYAGIILRNNKLCAFGAFPGQYRYIHVKILKTTSGNVSFKLEKKDGERNSVTPCEVTEKYSPSGQWQEIVFDMGIAAGVEYSDYFIMPDRADYLQGAADIYIDDIVLKPDPNAGSAERTIELPGTFRLVWADEFNGDSYDPEIWSPQIMNGFYGSGNEELQYYTDRKENIFTRDGNLVLKAYKETYGYYNDPLSYTSGKLRTKNKKIIKYGRVEARFKLPEGRGTWPAIWMMPQNEVYGGWPHSGEIDVMEFVGHAPDYIYGTVHRGIGSGENGLFDQDSISIAGKADKYHVIRIDWEPGYIKWYLNDILFHTYNNAFVGNSEQWPFDQGFHLILNLAIGGNWGGKEDVDNSIFPQEFLIDYVRVYQKPEATTPVEPEEIVIENFEFGSHIWESIDAVAHEIVDNPHIDGVNSSAKVMKLTRKAGTVNYAGIILRDNITCTFGAFPGQYRYVGMKIFKTTRGDVSFKLEKGGNVAPYESSLKYSPSGQWQEVVFDMGGAAGTVYDDCFFMPDRAENPSSDIVVYIDDIVLKPDPNAGSVERTIELPGTFRLVWADEFNGESYNPEIWSPQILNGYYGSGNEELQYYTDRKENIFTRDGNLVLKAYKETYKGLSNDLLNYTSGKLWTKDKKAIKYGRVEARFKLPEGRGTWPAIWMMPQDEVYGGWPRSGEIDVMEFVGYDPYNIYGTVHRIAGSGQSGNYANGNSADITGKTDEYHVIRIDWEPGYIKWYLNDILFHTYNNAFIGDSEQWPFDKEFYLILNFAVGGNWGGAEGVDNSIFPQEFLIDYVRVYQKSEEPEEPVGPVEPVEPIEPIEPVEPEETAIKPVRNTLFSVYPLSKEKLKITSFSNLPVNAVVYSLTGERLLSTKAAAKDFTVDVSGLHPGMYIIIVSDGSRSHTQKFVK